MRAAAPRCRQLADAAPPPARAYRLPRDLELIVDLTTTSFIDGSVAFALYDAYRAETPPRIRFVVAPGTPPYRLFDLIGLDHLFPVYRRLKDALV